MRGKSLALVSLVMGALFVSGLLAQPAPPTRDHRPDEQGQRPDGPSDQGDNAPPGRPGPPDGFGRGPRSDFGPGEGRRPPMGDQRGPQGGGPYGPQSGGPYGRPDGAQHSRFHHDHDMRRMEELKEIDPELYELETKDRELDRQTFELADQYRRAPRDKRESLKEELENSVTEHFDVRQARRELHLHRLEEELDKLRTSIERRKEVREQIIGQRVAELLGEEDDLAF